MKNPQPLIRLAGVSFAYPEGKTVLRDLDFQLNPGERIGLMAPNGSGKTTLLHIMMGLLAPGAGKIEIFGKPVRVEKDFLEARQKIGLLFQDADDQLFSPTVLEDVAFGPLNLGKTREEAAAISRETLRFLGLEGFEERISFRLSGGEKKLVALATILAMAPHVLLLDEPVNGLDIDTREKLIHILLSLDTACLLISHDIDFLSQTADHIYTMENGRILVEKELHIHQHAHAHTLGDRPHKHHK
jgi:cobalt/nickel transport system ATP-binding protein